jgi:hypothetical protein
MKYVIVVWGALAGGLVAVTSAGAALADTAVTPEPAAPAATAAPATTEQTTYYRPPNRAVLAGGILAFLGSYGPAVAVAAANHNSYDNNLYIPIAGPWLDLRSRPGCGGPGEANCTSKEDGSKALLVVSGVFQALGVLTVALGLVVPEKHHITVQARADKPTVRVLPAQVGRDGYGLAASGTF